jgi:hypothetical protein
MSLSPTYIGSGPYCYTNSLAMVIGPGSPDPSVIEVLTGSPFGFWMLGGTTPFFDPPGWDPIIGLEAAIDLLGWDFDRTDDGNEVQAIERLRQASEHAPVVAGPVEFGLMLHHPGAGTVTGSDHYVVVTEVAEDMVRFHDPHGHPHATLPTGAFAAAWRAETIAYSSRPYTMWAGARRLREVNPLDALRSSLPAAARWASGAGVGHGSGDPGGADACLLLAERAEAGLENWQRDHLAWFAIQVGARRLADAARWLRQAGANDAAAIADLQARLIGALQYPVVHDDRTATAGLLRRLAPTYQDMAAVLAAHAQPLQ